MKLRSISISNVRKFGGKTATLSGIGDGITVVSEANEFGKSTFFDALHALFFEKFGGTGKPIRSLQPRSGGSVHVAAKVETANGVFLIEKRWLSQKSARVTDQSTGRLIAADGEAEAWIADLIGDSRDGPAGLLWVRQGLVGLEPGGTSGAEKAEKERLAETRRDLLSSVAGEIDAMTGGQRMDRVLRMCRADLETLTTKTTGRPSGIWKTTLDQVKTLTEELETLDSQCAALSSALAQRADIITQIAQIDAPANTARHIADLEAAQRTANTADAHAALASQARQTAQIATLERDEAARRLDTIVAAQERLASTRAKLTQVQTTQTDAQEAVTDAEAAANHARTRAAHLTAQANALQVRLGNAHQQAATQSARIRLGELKGRLAATQTQRDQIETLTATLSTNTATPAQINAAQDAQTMVTQLTTALAAEQPSLRMTYSADTRLMIAGKALPNGTAIAFTTDVTLDLPGLGQLVISAGALRDTADTQAALAQASTALEKALQACGADSLPAARAIAATRAQAAAALDLAKGRLDATAPEGIDTLRAAVQAATHAAGARQDTVASDPTGVIDTPDAMTSELASLTPDLDIAEQALGRADRQHTTARETSAVAVAALVGAQQAYDEAKRMIGDVSLADSIRQDASRELSLAQVAVTDTTAKVVQMDADAPDVLTARANLKRAQDTIVAQQKRRADLVAQRSELSGRIETQAGRSIEERRDATADALATVSLRAERLSDQAASLTCLRDALEATRTAARDAYFGPVKEELTPLLRILHDDADLQFNSDTMLPGALSRGTGTDAEDLETLSGGTQEQIAILTRLAFARLFARKGRQMPIILDDALVYSDDSRIVQMFTALNRVAMDQQILVFSCRQMAFESLGGDRPTITITQDH